MKATDRLKAEHDIIKKVLSIQESVDAQIQRGESVSPDLLSDIVLFLRTYADERHHYKEENLLFPALTDAGMPRDGGPVGVMLYEHELGRKMITAMADAAEREKRGHARGNLIAFASAARQYCELLRGHIEKENNILFPMADRFLGSETQKDLLEKFEKWDAGRTAEIDDVPHLAALLSAD